MFSRALLEGRCGILCREDELLGAVHPRWLIREGQSVGREPFTHVKCHSVCWNVCHRLFRKTLLSGLPPTCVALWALKSLVFYQSPWSQWPVRNLDIKMADLYTKEWFKCRIISNTSLKLYLDFSYTIITCALARSLTSQVLGKCCVLSVNVSSQARYRLANHSEPLSQASRSWCDHRLLDCCPWLVAHSHLSYWDGFPITFIICWVNWWTKANDRGKTGMIKWDYLLKRVWEFPKPESLDLKNFRF